MQIRRAALAIVVAIAALVAARPARASSYLEIHVEGVINPVKARYVARAMQRAEAEHVEFVLVVIDTPGGLITSMEEIAKSFTNGQIPVVGYVWPKTAQATSAGALVLLATDIAAMAPDTRVGSAHPVGPEGKDLPTTMNEKATQSMIALAKSLASRRGRPAEYAEAIVQKSESYTAAEAKTRGAIEILAADRADLIAQLDGRHFDREGRAVTLHTRGASLIEMPLSSAERVLDVLAEPTIASMLLSVGVMAILYELASPGIGMAGIVGVLSVILGLVGVSVLPVRAAALLLEAAGLIAIVIEAKVSAHGLVALGGVVAVIIGGLFLVDETAYFGALQMLHWQFFAPFLLLVGVVFVVVVRAVRRAMGTRLQTGSEAMMGRRGVAKGAFVQAGANWAGNVFVEGARWSAECDTPLVDGDRVTVIAVLSEPMRLRVQAETKAQPATRPESN